jgi:hypothetical protein
MLFPILTAKAAVLTAKTAMLTLQQLFRPENIVLLRCEARATPRGILRSMTC